MKHFLRRTIGVGATALFFLVAGAQVTGVAAQDPGRTYKARKAKTPPPIQPPTAQQQKLPPRVPFTVADDAVAEVPGMPDARFWADSETTSKRHCRHCAGRGLSFRPAAPTARSAPDCSMA